MLNDLVREINPAAGGQNRHQFLLDLLRCLAFGQAEAARDAKDVRIHHDALGFLKGNAQDNVGRFTRRAGDGD